MLCLSVRQYRAYRILPISVSTFSGRSEPIISRLLGTCLNTSSTWCGIRVDKFEHDIGTEEGGDDRFMDKDAAAAVRPPRSSTPETFGQESSRGRVPQMASPSPVWHTTASSFASAVSKKQSARSLSGFRP